MGACLLRCWFPVSPLPLLSNRTAWCRLCVEELLGLLDITPWVWSTTSIPLPSWRQQHSVGRVPGRVESLLPPSIHHFAYLLMCLCSPLATGCFFNSPHQWPGAVFQCWLTLRPHLVPYLLTSFCKTTGHEPWLLWGVSWMLRQRRWKVFASCLKLLLGV